MRKNASDVSALLVSPILLLHLASAALYIKLAAVFLLKLLEIPGFPPYSEGAL